MEKKYNKKKAIKGVATAAVLVSFAVGMLFNSANDITPEQVQPSVNRPPIVMDIDEFANATVDDDDDDATDEKKASTGVVARIKQAMMKLPYSVRLLIITPLWVIGTVALTVLSVVWRALIASPIGVFLATAAAGFIILLALYVGTAKVLFPDVTLRKILSRGALISLGVVSLLLAGIDAIAPLLWGKYPFVSGLAKLAIGVSVVGILSAKAKKLSETFQRGSGLA